MTPKLTFYRVNYCTVLYMPYIYMDNIQFSAKHLISDALISEWIWKNTQQITGLPRHGARMSFDYKPGSGNINSSDTVVGQFSFRWEESETDGFNLICIGQGFATWQIVSHLLLLWALHRQAYSAANLLFMEAIRWFKPKLMMSPSRMFSVGWLCNHIEVECPRTQHKDMKVPIILLCGFSHNPTDRTSCKSDTDRQVEIIWWLIKQSNQMYWCWILVCTFENPDFYHIYRAKY